MSVVRTDHVMYGFLFDYNDARIKHLIDYDKYEEYFDKGKDGIVFVSDGMSCKYFAIGIPLSINNQYEDHDLTTIKLDHDFISKSRDTMCDALANLRLARRNSEGIISFPEKSELSFYDMKLIILSHYS